VDSIYWLQQFAGSNVYIASQIAERLPLTQQRFAALAAVYEKKGIKQASHCHTAMCCSCD
jgi:hypothetical protein